MASMEEHSRKLESGLPAGMHFDGTPLKDVLETIAKGLRLKLRPWKDEGNREALEAVVGQIDGEGVVMIRTWAGSWGQYRLVDKRREP